ADYKNRYPYSKVSPRGVNFIAHRSNKRYTEDLEMIRKHQPPIVITSLGDPGPVVEVVHHYDGLALSDVINPFFAKKAYETAAAGLIRDSSGAGGHGCTLKPLA